MIADEQIGFFAREILNAGVGQFRGSLLDHLIHIACDHALHTLNGVNAIELCGKLTMGQKPRHGRQPAIQFWQCKTGDAANELGVV